MFLYRIKLKTFNEKSSVETFAQQVLKACKYINPNKAPYVQGLLNELKQRIVADKGISAHAPHPNDARHARREGPSEEEIQSKIQAEVEAKVRARIEEEMRLKAREEEHKRREVEAERDRMAAILEEQQREKEEKARLQAEEEERERQEERDREARKEKERKARKAKKAEKSRSRNDRPKRGKKKSVASMKKIDDYIEMLYEEDMDKKVKGTSLLLDLASQVENIDYFIDSDTIIGALSRVLGEDRKKSTELSTNILEIFFIFSQYSQLHPILLQNKIGDTTMRIIDFVSIRT